MGENKYKIIRNIILVIIPIILVTILAIALNNNINIVKNNSQTMKMKGTQEFSYDVYSNEEEKIMALIKIQNEEGIGQVKYPNNEMTIDCKGRQSISIDYEIEEGKQYTFSVVDINGQEKEHEIGIENLDDWIKIDIESEKEKGTTATAIITYGKEEIQQYVIGADNESWQTYSGDIKLDSYTIISQGLGNADGTVTIKARMLDTIGNKIQVIRNVACLDIDQSDEPVITQVSTQPYAILTQYGVKLESKVSIKYDSREDITNYYSIDNGNTWLEYNGEFVTTSVKVLAKSVKNETGLEIQKILFMSPSAKDAVPVAVYDGNNSSYARLDDEKLDIDASMYNKDIILRNAGGIEVIFKDSSGNTLLQKSAGTSGSMSIYNTTITVPENAVEMRFEYRSGTQRVFEIKVQ